MSDKPQKRERIKVLKSCRGSEDGAKVLRFEPDGGEAGDGVYEVAENLAIAFVDEQKTAERTGLAKAVDKVKEVVSGKGKKAEKPEGEGAAEA